MKFQVHLTCVFCPTFTTIYIYSRSGGSVLVTGWWWEWGDTGHHSHQVIRNTTVSQFSHLEMTQSGHKSLLIWQKKDGPWHGGCGVGTVTVVVLVYQLKWKVVTRLLCQSVSRLDTWTHGDQWPNYICHPTPPRTAWNVHTYCLLCSLWAPPPPPTRLADLSKSFPPPSFLNDSHI